MLSKQVFQPSYILNSIRQKSVCHRMIDGSVCEIRVIILFNYISHFVFSREPLTTGVRGQLEEMGSLLPSAGSGVELKSSDLATNILTAFHLASLWPSVLTPFVQKEHRGQERWTNVVVGFSSDLIELVSEMLGVVYLGQCGWDTSGLRPFLSEGWECGPHAWHFHSALRVPVGTDPTGLLLQCARFLPPATGIFTIGLGSFCH